MMISRCSTLHHCTTRRYLLTKNLTSFSLVIIYDFHQPPRLQYYGVCINSIFILHTYLPKFFIGNIIIYKFLILCSSKPNHYEDSKALSDRIIQIEKSVFIRGIYPTSPSLSIVVEISELSLLLNNLIELTTSKVKEKSMQIQFKISKQLNKKIVL